MQVTVWGVGSGIVAEVAMRLAQQGYHLIVSGSNRSKLEILTEKLPTSTDIEVIDLSQSNQVETLCERLRDNYPPLDIAFINAGIVEPGDFADRNTVSIDREIDINFRSAVHLIQACIAGLNYIHLPFDAASPAPGVADKFLAALGDEANQPVYIHCA